MQSIFNVSDEEAKRIRLLHESESQNKKIDSTLITEQAQCGGQGQTPGKAVGWTNNCPGSPNLLNPFPCAMVDGQTPHSGMIGYQINIGGGHMNFCATISSVGPFQGNLTSTTPTPLERSNSCTDCTSPYGTGNQTSVNCNNGNCVTIPGTTGQFATMSDCQRDCEQANTRHSCVNGQCQPDPNGQYLTAADCIPNCPDLPSLTYDCGIQGTCVPVQGAGGQYLTMADCQEECQYDGKWTCKKHTVNPQAKIAQSGDEQMADLREQALPTSGYHCVKDPNGQYNTKQECEDDCPRRRGDRGKNCINCKEGIMTTTQMSGTKECPPGFVAVSNLTQGPCVECQNGVNCTAVGWGYGPNHFNSMAECQASPTCGQANNYSCVGSQCIPDPNGPFTGPNAQADCNANCPPQPNLWECDPSGPTSVGCTQTPTGTHQSKAGCESACCQDVIANYGWATNHPNATANQACQRLFNEFGSSTPGPQAVFSDNCKYNYLMNIVNTGGGCGNQSFMGLLEGFAGTPNSQGNNGCYGNPASGCDTSPGAPFNPPYQNCPHQNSICGKKAQFCGVINNYQAWWKCAWATDFANGTVQGPGGPPYSNPTYPCTC